MAKSKGKRVAIWSASGLVFFLLITVSIYLMLGLMVDWHWIETPIWLRKLDSTFDNTAEKVLVGGENLKSIWQVIGVLSSAVAAAMTLLASWHFAEMNLPSRLNDLVDSNLRDHLTIRPEMLAAAQVGLGRLPIEIERSRITFARSWLSGLSPHEGARTLAASIRYATDEAKALADAANEAQQRVITGRLVRGYHFAALGDHEQAFENFNAATRVRPDDVVSRDAAAGWARHLGLADEELRLLHEIQTVAGRARGIDHARALRREAEILRSRAQKGDRGQKGDWEVARDKLQDARKLLLPLENSDSKAKGELGRVVTLFCDIQRLRGVVDSLVSPNGLRNKMLEVVARRPNSRRREEGPSAEEYGVQFATQVSQMIDDLSGDPAKLPNAAGDT